MKKLLLTTTAIAAFGFAAEAEANSLQVNVGGYVDFQAGFIDDEVHDTTVDANDTDFNTDAEIHISVEGKADNGLEYGAVVELEADVDTPADTYEAGTNADKAFVYLQGGWGRVEAGENTGAEEALAVNTGDFASATGGVEGDFYRYVTAPTAVGGAVTDNGAAETISGDFDFIIRPQLLSAHSGTGSITDVPADEDATKITYYSPRFSGFQLGVSYTPNSGDTIRQGASNVTTADAEDLWSGGINFTEQFDEVGVAASLTALSGDSKAAGVAAAGGTTATGIGGITLESNQDIEGFAAGINVSFAGFTVGGSYGDYQDTIGNFDSDYFDLGLGYAAGPWSASVTYLASEVDKSSIVLNQGADNAAGGGDDDILVRETEFENLVVGVDYQLAPGFVPYVEAAFYEFDGALAGANDNDGSVVMVGTELTF